MALRRGEQCFGVLALASEDAQRFYPEMGTLYLERIGELLAVRSGATSPRSVSPPASAIARYLDFLRHERRLAAHTLTAYARDGELLVKLAAGRDPGGLAAVDIRRFVATLHGGGLAPRSLARLLSSWRGFYDWLARHREVAANPCKGIRAPRAARTLPEALSPDDASRLVALDDGTATGVRDRALFELAYSCGLRVSELTGLDLGSVDAAAGEVRVTGKGSKTRIVPVGGPALEALARWLPVRARLAAAGRDGALRRPRGQAPVAARGAAPHQAPRRGRGAHRGRAPAHAAPLVRLARAAVLGRPARGAGDARATRASPPRRSTRTSTSSTSPRSTTRRTRGRAARAERDATELHLQVAAG